MTLLQARKDFVVMSGRYDLVVDYEGADYDDNGANLFIRAGQRWLDRRNDIAKSEARYFKSLTAGDWYSLIPESRSIRSVWMSDSDGAKWQLDRKDREAILAEFGGIPSAWDSGTPTCYALISTRTIAEIVGTIKFDQYGATSFTAGGTSYSSNAIMWYAAAPTGTILEVHGLFYQPTLRADSDQNLWTEEHSFILTLAACRALEISMRNSTGVKDWESAIDSELLGMEFDYVDQISSEIHELEG